MSLEKHALANNLFTRLDIIERKLDDLYVGAAMAQTDPTSGGITYIEILRELTAAEGPDITITDDASSVTIGRAGDTILLFDSDGEVLSEYVFTSAGLIAGLAAMAAGDVLEPPAGIITGGPWTVANGTLKGISAWGSVLDGQVTVQTDCDLERLSVIRSENTGVAVSGVILITDGRVEGCFISITNAGGAAYGIYSEAGSNVYANGNIIIVVASTTGYAYYSNGSILWAEGGYVEATTAPVGVA